MKKDQQWNVVIDRLITRLNAMRNKLISEHDFAKRICCLLWVWLPYRFSLVWHKPGCHGNFLCITLEWLFMTLVIGKNPSWSVANPLCVLFPESVGRAQERSYQDLLGIVTREAWESKPVSWFPLVEHWKIELSGLRNRLTFWWHVASSGSMVRCSSWCVGCRSLKLEQTRVGIAKPSDDFLVAGYVLVKACWTGAWSGCSSPWAEGTDREMRGESCVWLGAWVGWFWRKLWVILMTSFGSLGFGRLDTTLATVGSETQTHGICALVQTPVVGSESRVPEEEPKLVVKTDLGFQVKPKFSSVSRMCSRSGEPLCSRQAKGQSASHLLILLVFFLDKVQTKSSQIAYGVPCGFLFLDLVRRSWVQVAVLSRDFELWQSCVLERELFVDCDTNNFGSNGGLVDNAFSFDQENLDLHGEQLHTHKDLLVTHVKSSVTL